MIQKIKRPVSILLVFMMVVSVFAIVPFTASAEEWSGDIGAHELSAGDIITSQTESVMELNEYTVILREHSYGKVIDFADIEPCSDQLEIEPGSDQDMRYEPFVGTIVISVGDMETIDYAPTDSQGNKADGWLVLEANHDEKRIVLAGVGSGYEPAAATTYTITWLNDDGTELDSDEVKEGETPVYSGPALEKPETENSFFVFTGWDDYVYDATEDATYTATFAEIPKFGADDQYEAFNLMADRSSYSGDHYTVSSRSYGDTGLGGNQNYKISVSAKNGEIITKMILVKNTVASSADPVVFVDGQAVASTNNKNVFTVENLNTSSLQIGTKKFWTYVTHVFVFYRTAPTHTITWKNHDGSVIKTDEVREGQTPVYTGATPTKAEDEDYIYNFEGWTPALAPVTGDATYTAQFSTVSKADIAADADRIFTENESFNDGLTVDTEKWYISENTTVTINKGLKITGELTVLGKGTLIVNGAVGATGEDGKIGEDGEDGEVGGNGEDGATGGEGGAAVAGNIKVDGVTVRATGGNGGNGGNGGDGGWGAYGEDAEDEGEPTPGADGGNGGNGGNGGIGGYAFAGNVTIVSGEVYGVGGNGGNGGNGGDGGNGGVGGYLWIDDDVEDMADDGEDGDPGQSGSSGDPQNAFKNEPIIAEGSITKFRGGSTQSGLAAVDTVTGYRYAVITGTLPAFTVTWKNEDGTVLETDENVEYGNTPSYDGATPEKAGDAQFTYTFDGWTPEITAVTGDAEYTAQFSSTVNQYTITWKNDDGTVIDTTSVAYGEIPTHTDVEKAADAQFTYTFEGWTPEITAVTGDAEYTAQFSSTVNQYTITWKNDDGSVIDTAVYEYGAMPTHEDPEKAADEQYTYTFDGWTPEITAVTGDAEYTATYNSDANEYTVTWKNGDDVLKIDTVAFGETPVYTGATPTKAADGQISYIFDGWDPAITPVIGDVEYNATFKEIKLVKNGPQADGFFYLDDVRQNAYRVVKFEGDYYFISDAHKIAKSTRIYLGDSFVAGTGLAAGYYDFDADGKIIIKNGPQADGFFYVNGARQNAYRLVEFEGNYYFINDGHKIAKNTRIYLGDSYVAGTGLTAGYYDFDADGKLVIKNGPQADGYFYLNGVRQNAYRVVEFEGDYYFINDGHKLAKNTRIYLGDSFVAGTGLAAGYYDFDADGKIVIKNGPQADGYFYVNGARQNAYRLVEFEGDYYFINDGHKYVKNTRLYMSERFVNGYDLAVGYYTFGADGKMVTAA